jgi:NADPH:quinone reductase-like Zn-dependent oxidoreductase
MLKSRHTINLISGRPCDGAFALYTIVPANKTAILPATISFTSGVVIPFALEAAICALSLKEPSEALPGVPTPALGLPYPSLSTPVPSLNKTVVVYGGSASTGVMVTQLATLAGLHVLAITSPHNFALSKRCGAREVFDYKDASLVENVVEAVTRTGHEFVGIFDAISSPTSYTNDLALLGKLGGGHLACTHPPPADVPENVKAGMIFAVNDVATPVWEGYVAEALGSGVLECLPLPDVVGKGLECVQEALGKCKAGVSGRKVVVEL